MNTDTKTPCEIALDVYNKNLERNNTYFQGIFGKEWAEAFKDNFVIEMCGMKWVKISRDDRNIIWNQTHRRYCYNLCDVGQMIVFHQQYIKLNWWGKRKLRATFFN